MLYSNYYMPLKLLKNGILGVKKSSFCYLLTQSKNRRHNAVYVNKSVNHLFSGLSILLHGVI